MKLLAFSDLHRDIRGAERLVELSSEADVVLAAGDLASVHEGLGETVAALRSIETPTLLVPGNNETEEALRAACENWDSATVLHGGGAEIDGREFFGLGAGVPVTPWDWSFDLDESEAAEMLAGCPAGAVLVLHSPPEGHVDAGLGSSSILAAIEAKQPPLAVCGHIHQCWGEESVVGGTRVMNLGPCGNLHRSRLDRNRQLGGTMISKLDFIGIPSRDAERSRKFYVETLGLRADEDAKYEVWLGDTCFAIWEPEKMGAEFAPQKNAHPALHVEDVAAVRAELEAKGVEFPGEIFDTGVCHMAFFTDPDGNDLMLHHRYAPTD